MNKNIKYRSQQLLDIYTNNRQTWAEFYPSEQWVFEKISGDNKNLGNVLDVGCACGGLGVALTEKFKLNSYTGVDINDAAILWARNERKLDIPAKFIAQDIIELESDEQYDTVVSLSCADWNVETRRIIDACWKRVKPGGYFVISLRLSEGEGVNDIEKSYQLLGPAPGENEPEIANYVVFGFKEAVNMIKGLFSSDLAGAYGYWGKPSDTAYTPFEKIVFSVFYIRKSEDPDNGREMITEWDLPPEILV